MTTQESAITYTKQKIEKWSALVKSCREGSCGALYAIQKLEMYQTIFKCIVATEGVYFIMKCIGCYYYRSLSQNKYMDDFCCHYLIDTGSMRKIILQNAIVMQVHLIFPKRGEPKKWNK